MSLSPANTLRLRRTVGLHVLYVGTLKLQDWTMTDERVIS